MIFIALLAGALAGVIINYLIPSNYVVDDIIVQGVFYIVGQGFIRLMRMLVVPLVFCSLANMGDRVDIVKNFFGQFNDIMMEMTMAVMKLAPIGVFCLIAKTFAEIGFEVFIPLLKYMFCVLLALAVQCFVVYL